MDDSSGNGTGEFAPWDQRRINALGPPLIAAADAAGIGLAVVLVEESVPRFLYVTEAGAQIFGSSPSEIVGRSALALVSPDGGKGIPGTTNTGRTPLTFDTKLARSDGKYVPVEVRTAPMELQGQSVLLAFFRDVSERDQSIEALRQSEARFRRLIELAPDGVWISDRGRLLYVNPRTVRMLGYESAESVLALNAMDIVHPDDQASMIQRTREMLASGESMPPMEYRIRKRDGSAGLTEVQSMPIEWEGRQVILGFARDVSARKQMEGQLIRSERLAALGTLLAGIAHEMNNPLAYVSLGVEQVIAGLEQLPGGGGDERDGERPDGQSDGSLPRLRQILEEVRGGVNRVAAVVKQLRASSRPDGPERGTVDVEEALQSALRVAGNEIRHRARLVTSLAHIPPIEGSSQRLEQVFLNLLVNAAQALPEGRPDNEISVSLRVAAGQVIVEIADNGRGIPPEILPRIFDPFFTTKAVGVGMGLGLSICHGIVTAQGGSIDVESEQGRGTKFRVLLPLRPSAMPEAPPVERFPQTLPPAGQRRRVLVVDDEPALGSMIRNMLLEDFDVDVVTDGAQGLSRLCAGTAYHVILCDIMMPKMTGMDLYTLAAQQRPGIERRFVFMTGGAFTVRATEFLATVRNRRLYKPFDVAALRAIVEQP